MSGERTEQPTAHRLKEARKQGQIARSRDLAIAVASVASTMAMAYTGSHLIHGLMDLVRSGLDSFGNAPLTAIAPTELGALMLRSALQLATLVGPLALVTMVAAVGMHGFQGGWSFAPGALRLNWSRLNPSSGAKARELAGSALTQFKAPKERTSAKLASIASDVLRDGRSSDLSKELAGSVLSQRKK